MADSSDAPTDFSGHRARLLDKFITEVRERSDPWFATHADVAAFVTS